MRRALCGLVILAACAAQVQAGFFSEGLEHFVADKAASQSVTVLLSMRVQAPVAEMDAQLAARKASLAERHQLVVSALMDTATRTQAELLDELSRLKAQGKVNGFTPYWITNAVVVNAPISIVRQLAARSDVEVAEANLVVEGIMPVIPPKGLVIDPVHVNRVVTSGLAAINADDVWNLLGINGTGALVGSIDTGVEGTHPALSANWRGNHGFPVSQCWLDAAALGHASPQDGNGHGTHTTGTMVGINDIGVAPGAWWIASNIINSGTGSTFDNGVIASFQFMADPDGNPATVDDMPDVVQNSWGVNESFSGYLNCDSRWWSAIDNCEAVGVCVTFSAGNEGSGASTLRSPADRAISPYNCFSVGATDPASANAIASFSSRGPSTCTGDNVAHPIKPEVSAPGVNTYSSYPGGGYTTMSGTSMAGPHVAGVVALMRAANPNVDVNTIKQVLMDTATDMGSLGDDNTYGHGHVDAYAAVLAVMSGFGTVAGTVTDAVTGMPLSGVVVDNLAGPQQTSTNASGSYSLMLAEGSYTLDFSAFGYSNQSLGVTVLADATTTRNLALSSAPTALLSGFVTDANGTPVAGATVDFTNVNWPDATTDAGGFYSTSLPVGFTYQVTAYKVGVGSRSHSVVFSGAQSLDFSLPIYEGFESGAFNAFPWVQSGNLPWQVTSDQVYEGTRSAKSGTITHSQTSTMSVTMNLPTADLITFRYKVSSESGYDYLRFLVDGVQQNQWSGEVAWSQASFTVDAGTHTFAWTYYKDGSVNTGSDAVWVDEILWPQAAYPELDIQPAALQATVAPEGETTQELTLANLGAADLSWTASVQTLNRERAAGGPDAFGYSWSDSNEPGGPAFNWVDISAVGTNAGTGDNSNLGPFNLGFPFSFYGTDYTSVRICTNGYLSFTSTSTTGTNAAIPNAAAPNALVAPFWDNLNVTTAGMLKYYSDVANQRFIVSWIGVPRNNGSGTGTFQAILHGDGRITYQYQSMGFTLTSATVGVENETGTVGLQMVHNAAYVGNGLAVEIGTEQAWLVLNPASGTVAPGGSTQVTASFSAVDLALGTYNGNIILTSNDVDEGSVSIPVTLIVGNSDSEGPVITLNCLEDSYGDLARDVTATVSDVSGVSSATLFFSADGAEESSLAMASMGGDQWMASLPGLAAPAQMSYRVDAVDASSAGNGSSSAPCSYNVLPLASPVATLQTQEDGTLLLSWTAVEGALSYQVYEAGQMGGSENLVLSTISTQATLPGGMNSTRIYRVRAIH